MSYFRIIDRAFELWDKKHDEDDIHDKLAREFCNSPCEYADNYFEAVESALEYAKDQENHGR